MFVAINLKLNYYFIISSNLSLLLCFDDKIIKKVIFSNFVLSEIFFLFCYF